MKTMTVKISVLLDKMSEIPTCKVRKPNFSSNSANRFLIDTLHHVLLLHVFLLVCRSNTLHRNDTSEDKFWVGRKSDIQEYKGLRWLKNAERSQKRRSLFG